MDTVVETGKPGPDFTLTDLAGNKHRLSDFRGKIVVINFWSAECPWSERTDEVLQPMISNWGSAVTLFPVASNANESIEELSQQAAKRGMDVVLHDVDQAVAEQYGAVTTPHIFVIDKVGVLRYQGAFDDVTFRQREPTVNYLHKAVEALLADELPELGEIPSYGCSVVYHTV